MTHSKNNTQGFTLIEMMITLMVIGLVVVPLLTTQMNVMRGITSTTEQQKRFVVARHYLIETAGSLTAQEPTLNIEKKHDDPVTILRFSASAVDTRSVLHRFKNMYRQQVTYEWVDADGKRDGQVVTFMLQPESKSS